MKREWFVFYQSFLRAGENLEEKDQLLFYKRVLEYWIDGENETTDNWIVEAMFLLVKPQLDANNKKFENGKKGGRPKQDETKDKPKNNLNKTKAEPKEKEKVNANVKEKENVKDKYLEFVKLTKEEHKKLIDKFWIFWTDDRLEKLNSYIGSKWTKYKSHYHTILNWSNKEKKDDDYDDPYKDVPH